MRQTLTRWLAVSSLLFATPAFAAASAWTLDKSKSSLTFIAIQNGAPVEGKFTDFTADIRFDHDKPEQSHIEVDVNTGSVAVADEDIEKNVKLPEWLSTAAFPKAVFTCDKLTRMPDSENYYGNGTLTLRGKAVPVVLNFQMEHFDPGKAIANGYVTLRRNEFGVGQGQWAKDDVIKNEVRVEFRIVAEKK